MIYVYMLLTAMSVFMEYEFWTSTGFLPLPFIQIIQEPNVVLGVAQLVAVKWFLPLGVIGIIFGIIGIVKPPKDEQASKLTITILIFYAIFTFLGVL